MNLRDFLQRATVKEICTYILTGTILIPDQEEKDLGERQEEAYQLIDAALAENGIPEDSPLRESINEYEYLLSTVYMEIGFRAGFNFKTDISNVQTEENKESEQA